MAVDVWENAIHWWLENYLKRPFYTVVVSGEGVDFQEDAGKLSLLLVD